MPRASITIACWVALAGCIAGAYPAGPAGPALAAGMGIPRAAEGTGGRMPSRPILPPTIRSLPRTPGHTGIVPPGGEAASSGPAAPPVDYAALEAAIRAGASKNAGRDTVWSRVFGNWWNDRKVESCVEASEARAADVAAEIRRRMANGELDLRGHTVTVGTRSGYQILGASFHTYTVIEVKDPSGKAVRTMEVDTYVVPVADIDSPDDFIGPPTPVKWNDPAQQATPREVIE